MEHHVEPFKRNSLRWLRVVSVPYLGNSVKAEVNPVMRNYGVSKAVCFWLLLTREFFSQW